MSTSVKLALEFLQNNAANQSLANLTFAQLDQLVQAGVADKDLTTPPGSPTDGALYIVASGNWGTGSSKANQLAYWLDTVGAWSFIVPLAGWSVRMLDELDSFGVPKIYVYTGSAWTIPDAGTATAAPAAVVVDSTTARTLGLVDIGKYLRFTNTSAKTVTVPPQSGSGSVNWTDDAEVNIRNAGTSNLTLTPGSGVTLNAPYLGTLVVPTGGTVTLKRASSDVWDVIGQTV